MSKPALAHTDAAPVEVRNLRKRYGKGAWANDGISFAALGGEIAPTAPARPP